MILYYIITSFLPPKSLTHTCELTAKYMKTSSKTIAKWRDKFIESGTICETNRGKYVRTQSFNDEGLKEKRCHASAQTVAKKDNPI